MGGLEYLILCSLISTPVQSCTNFQEAISEFSLHREYLCLLIGSRFLFHFQCTVLKDKGLVIQPKAVPLLLLVIGPQHSDQCAAGQTSDG